ncbi:AzlD domain-containing protein [Paeniglutamicibacter cryotolerans]|uniref:Putative membrane protein n=1 Tax=Paeniglutamicibacter cryotolerans TaxID=670079 RepID=A0A839QJZ0_9MICC|nr:AzlD domain-containing protein [Paeniglutamicibacter cryotolerans]MBB2995064.1 putative membrane protein [Paeniglutamicibacter cryotolerans]
MSTWTWILLAAAVAYLTKLLGYLVPARVLENERALRAAGTVTIGLLASLTMVNTVSAGTSVIIDARAGALVAALVALLLRAPFLAVVIAGAAAAAVLRLLGAR